MGKEVVGEAVTSEAGVVGKFNNNSYKWSKAMRASTGSDSGVIFEVILTGISGQCAGDT